MDIEAENGARAGRAIKARQPDVVVFYLTRLPSHGRETADGPRSIKATLDIPIVFVDGKDEAIEKTRARVPTALYATAEDLASVLEQIAGTNGVAPATRRAADEPVPPPGAGFRKIGEEAVMPGPARAGRSGSPSWTPGEHLYRATPRPPSTCWTITASAAGGPRPSPFATSGSGGCANNHT